MGLSVSPAIWQNFIQTVLEEIPNYRKHYLAIMDDIMIHSKQNDHMSLVVKLFKALIRNGLKISPKKCQLFKKTLVYMGHTMIIEDGLPKLKPLKTRIEAILKLEPPKTIKGCRSFCGMVNYLSIYLKDLQLKLIPIYHLTRKGIPFVWGEEQEKAFEDIKKALTSPPVLVMPDSQGHIILVSDTSKIGCGGALYQEIRHVYRLVSYCSKKLPEAVQRYSISELELTGLLANISIFKHILKNIKFTVFCDHSALVFIINAKKELPTLRLKKLIENLTAYCFVIRFLKGKEMHISDFLSRHPIENGESPHENIPIAFQLIEKIMQIKENEQGELYWATDYEQDVLYINALKDENVTNLFLAVFQEVNKGDLKVHNLCNSELGPVANSIRKRPLLIKSKAYVSSDIDNHNQCLDEARPNNQSVMIRDNKTDPVANATRKSERTASSTKDIDEHVKGKVKIPFSEIQDQCFIAATRSRSKEASEKVPDIFPLQGEHRKPEHVHKPKKDRHQPMIVQPPEVVITPQAPRDIPQEIDVIQPLLQKEVQRNRVFQVPKTESYKATDNIGPTIPSSTQQSMLDFIPRSIRNVPQDPITQHTDQRAKPKVYESLIKPMPVNVQLQGTLPPYDVDKIWEEKDWTPPTDVDKERKPLFKHIPDYQIFRAHIPKAAELKKFMKQLKSKVIHDYNLPISVKELRAEYPTSPAFKDIYNYVIKGTLHLFGSPARKFKQQCEDFVVMSGVLFKLRYDRLDKGKPSLVLCVPEKYLPTILYQYHESILAGHPGIVKLYEQLRRKYYFPGLLTIVHQYVKSCLECESTKPKLNEPKIHYPRIPLDYRPMARFSMDVKHMPKSNLGYAYILVCTCESTNWIVGIPIADEQAETIADALFYKIICTYGTPKAVICDEGSAFTSNLMQVYFHTLNIKPYYISPMNHGSNRSERYIRTLGDMICKYLTGSGINWPLFVAPLCYAMNTQISLITGFTPYEMIFHTKPPDLMKFDFNPDEDNISVTTRKYMQLMKHKAEMIQAMIKERKTTEAQSQYYRDLLKHPDRKVYKVGDLVYLYHGYGSELHAPAKKFQKNWIGPLKIQSILDDTHYYLSDWMGHLAPIVVHVHRIKPFTMFLGNLSKEGLLNTVSKISDLFDKWHQITKD